MRPGTGAFTALKERFGVEIIGATTGEVDRRALGSLVFRDAEAAAALNGIAWPAIADKLRELMDAIRARAAVLPATGRATLIFVEAAVLTAAGWHALSPPLFDEVWAVWSSRELRLARLAAGRSIPAASAELRMAAQPSDASVLRHCHVALSNLGPVEGLCRAGGCLADHRVARGRAALWPRAATGKWLRVVGSPPSRADLEEAAGDPGAGAWGTDTPGAAASPEGPALVEVPGQEGTAGGGVDVAAAKAASAAERVLLVDGENACLGGVRRSEMRAGRLWHRATYVFIRRRAARTTVETAADARLSGGSVSVEERVLVHRRTAWKDYCPSYMDTNSGGVVAEHEAGDEAASAERELAEEVGLGRLAGRGGPVPSILFSRRSETERARVWGAVADHDVGTADPRASSGSDEVGLDARRAAVAWCAQAGPMLRLQATEVVAAHWFTPGEVEAAAAVDDWTQDGLEFLRAFLRFRETGELGADCAAGPPPGFAAAGAGSDEHSSASAWHAVFAVGVVAAAVAVGISVWWSRKRAE